MKVRFAVFLALAVLLLGSATGFAQDAEDLADEAMPSAEDVAKAIGPQLGFGMEFGNVTINGTNYNTVRLQPDLALGQFGIGLDLNFEFDADGKLRVESWQGWQNILAKIMYIRWGTKGSKPVYVKAGSIDDFTLGHGTIMYKYSNMLNYPAERNLGLALDLDFNFIGFESMMGSLDFDVFGFRLFARPLVNIGIPIVKTLEVGATVAFDLDYFSEITDLSFFTNQNTTDVYVYGADLGAIVFDNAIIDMLTYFDFVGINGKGTGEVLGVIGKIISVIPYRFELRLTQPKFEFAYFDQFYDADKAFTVSNESTGVVSSTSKYDSLDSITESYAGWLFSSGIGILPNEDTGEDQITWSLTIEDSFADVIKPKLTMELYLSETLLKKIGAKFTWIRQNIAEWADLIEYESEDSILMLELDYYVSENLAISIEYKRAFKVGSTGEIEPFTTTALDTKLTF